MEWEIEDVSDGNAGPGSRGARIGRGGMGSNLALLARATAPAPRALDRRLELRGGHLDVQREKEQALL